MPLSAGGWSGADTGPEARRETGGEGLKVDSGFSLFPQGFSKEKFMARATIVQVLGLRVLMIISLVMMKRIKALLVGTWSH